MVAYRDIRCKRKFCIQAVRGIFAIVTLLLFSLLIVLSIHLYYRNEVAKCQKEYSVFLQPERDSISGALTEESRQAIELLSKQAYFESTIERAEIDLPTFAEMPDKAFVNLKYISVECGGKTFSYHEEESTKHSKLRATLFHSDYDVFSNVQTKSEIVLNGHSQLLSGREPEQDGEALLDETFLDRYGLKETDVLGKKLSVTINGAPLFSDITCVGILCTACVEIFPNDNAAFLWVNCGDTLFSTLPLENEIVSFIPYDFKSCEEISDLIKRAKIHNCFFDAEEAENCLYLAKIKQFSNVVLFSVTFMIVIALLLSLYSTLLEHIRESVNYYGMLSAIGMSEKNKYQIFCFEFLILFLIGLAAALPIGVLLFFLTSRIMNAQFSNELQIPVRILFECIGSVTLFVGTMTCLITASMLHRYFRMPITMQLKHDGF